MKNLLFILFLFIFTCNAFSQTLDDILEEESLSDESFVSATFNGTRIMNGQSIETRQKGVLEFLIQHRFGRINSGWYELFGLDNSNIRFGLEYSITNDLAIALGRSSFEKTFDGYVKYKILKQKTGVKTNPISLAFFGSAIEKTLRDYEPDDKPTFEDRLAYTSQLLIARKFSPSFSFQFTPSYIHFNTVPTHEDPNDIFALGFGARIKVSKRISVNGEYYYTINPFESVDTKNSLAVGIDIETGGHIFQIVLTNSRSMLEKGFIAETTGDFFSGDIHLGFNISRDFYLNKSKDEKKLY